MEKSPKVEIITETTIISTSTTDLDGNCDKEVTKTVSNRVNLEGLSEDFLRDYFGLKVTIDWDGTGKGVSDK
jgi:hypothetical protein